MCPSGWVGHSDFLNMDTTAWGGKVLECPSSVLLLRVLWSIPMPLAVSNLLSAPGAFRVQWQRYSALKAAGKCHMCSEHRPLVVLCGACLSMMFALAICVSKLSSTDLSATIGTSTHVTAKPRRAMR